MNSVQQISSLSTQLVNLNTNLTNNVSVIRINDISKLLNDTETNQVLIFEERHIPALLETTKNKSHNIRLICIGKNLSTEDRLVLLNHNIECLSPEKYKEIKLSFFEIKTTKNPFKVLVVEDDENQIIMTEHILKNANISVKSITQGEEVIVTLASYKPDLVLMDLYLDGVTGDEIVKSIRRIEKYRLLPIVFLTSDTSIETRMRVLNAGADDLLTKPINSDLLVSALKNRMVRNKQAQGSEKTTTEEVSTISEVPKPKELVDDNFQVVEVDEETELNTFFINNIANENASIIWLKIQNKTTIQKEFGFNGFKKLSQSIYNNLPINNVEFELQFIITDGICVLASDKLSQDDALAWIHSLSKWLEAKHLSIHDKEVKVEIKSVLLSNIPEKNEIDKLLENAEDLLLETPEDEDVIIIQSEGREERKFTSVKEHLEKAIKTRNFNWRYKTITPYNGQNNKIYEIELVLLKESGDEFLKREYSPVAAASGMQRILNRFMFENAIRIVGVWEENQVQTIALIKQDFEDFENEETRLQILKTIKDVNLPIGSIIFQFSMKNAKKYKNLLTEIRRDFKEAKIKICLTGFKATNDESWEIARTLKTSWINIKLPSGSFMNFSDDSRFDRIHAAIKKAKILCYKVLVSNVNDKDTIEKLKEMNVDYIQSNIK